MDSNVELSEQEITRYMRQIRLCEIGLEGQRRLAAAKVLVVGAGGLGCATLQYLAAAGIGKLLIIDPDRIELHNLQRQVLYATHDIGSPKAMVATEKLKALNPHIDIEFYTESFNLKNASLMVQKTDILIDATDNAEARYLINDACRIANKPFIYGSIHRYIGQVVLFAENGSDYRHLFPLEAPQEAMPSCAEGGVLGALPGIIGSIQAMECMKHLLQIGSTLAGKLMVLDALSWKVCIYQLDPTPPPLHVDSSLLCEWASKAVDVLHIDVNSVSLADIKEAARKHQKIVLSCPRGIRSAHIAQQLRIQGFGNAYALKNHLIL